MSVDVLTEKKTRPSKVYVVLSDCLGTHQRPDAPELMAKYRGDHVTTEELGPHCDVERLLRLRAITPLIAEMADPTFQLPPINERNKYTEHLFPNRGTPEPPPASINEATNTKPGGPPANGSAFQRVS